LSVWLNVIDACNFGCFYCYIPELQKNVDPKDIATGRYALDDAGGKVLAERLVSYCREQGLGSLNVKFAGGEPTLVIDRIDRFCAHIKDLADGLEITFTMLSNGAFAASEVLPVLERWSIGISISVDGMQSAHDRVRFTRMLGKREGSWASIMNNVAILKSHGNRPYFLYTITAKNLEDVEAFSEHIHGLGCGFRLSLERGSRPVDFETQRNTAAYLGQFYRRLATSMPTNIRFERAARFAEWNLRSKKLSACSSCRGYLAIGTDGSAASCQMRLDEPVGNLAEMPLSELIKAFGESPASQLLAFPERKRGGCTSCEFRHVCAGGCPQHTRNVSGDMDRPSPWCHVYGMLAPVYVEAAAIHLGRRMSATNLPRTAAPAAQQLVS